MVDPEGGRLGLARRASLSSRLARAVSVSGVMYGPPPVVTCGPSVEEEDAPLVDDNALSPLAMRSGVLAAAAPRPVIAVSMTLAMALAARVLDRGGDASPL